MYMNQSMESFENWRDSQYDRPEPDTDTPDEQIVRSYTFDYPNDTVLTYTRTGNSSELMLSFSSEDPDAGVEELMYAGDQGESMIELVSDLQAELTSWLDAADTSSFAEQQGMSTPDVSLIYGDYTRTALYAFESILKDVEHDLNNQITWKPVEAEKADWLYSSHEETDAERGCVGHLRGDFGRSGTEFWTSWFDHSPKLNNEEFRQELQTIVDGLRNEGGLLSNFASMRSSLRLKRVKSAWHSFSRNNKGAAVHGSSFSHSFYRLSASGCISSTPRGPLSFVKTASRTGCASCAPITARNGVTGVIGYGQRFVFTCMGITHFGPARSMIAFAPCASTV